MKKKYFGILIALIMTLVIAIPAAAITFGEPDDGRHPYVGLIGFYDEDWNWMWRCSGAMISDQVMLTAGHCTAYDPEYGTPAHARVWFDATIHYNPDIGEYTNPDFYDGIPVPHPDYAGLTIPETHDIGVVTFDEPIEGFEVYGQLPTYGLMDVVAKDKDKRDTIITSVGYGVNDMYPVEISLRTRYLAQSFVINLKNSMTDGWNIQSSNNPGQWPTSPGKGDEDIVTGGTCFGDSGGPVFLGGSDSHTIVGVTSFGNGSCSGSDFSYRVDIEDSRQFLSQFVDLGVVIP